MAQLKNLLLKHFGSLVVIARAESYRVPGIKTTMARWKCLCDCGKARTVRGDYLRQSIVTSCRACSSAHGANKRRGPRAGKERHGTK